MHELSIAAAVVESAEKAARDHGASSVESVRLRIGELSGVVADALRFSFEVATAGTMLDGAELDVEDVPGSARCTSCELEFAVGTPPQLWCPQCERTTTELLTGRELDLVGVRLPADTACPGTREVRQGESA
ncbi:hydrogenase maturation nickel metallochaperone HypA [Streptomyces sp. NPDC004647]|uniref:hydrogenase maturation nickel metallochaperone HypA n=1 Tax=Streptomyces sp. NPDC004647 TaxID=3154671 RepID=UPI0033A75D2D